MLRNRTYRGEIVHHGQSHPGEHPPVIDQPLWDAVQRRLAGNTAERNAGTRTHQSSLLAGMLFDAVGQQMTPSYAVKKGMRYRYYVSRPLITQDQRESSTALRIPAGEIEPLVASRVRQWLLDPGGIYQATRLPDPSAQRRLITRAGEIGKSWTELPGTRKHAFLTTLIERIDVGAHQIAIHLRPTRLAALLDVVATPLPSATEEETQIVSEPIRLRRTGRAITMLNRGDRPVCHSKTRCTTRQAADQGAPVQCHTPRQRWRALISSLTSRASGLAVANASVPSINILIARPQRRNRTGMDKI